MSGIFNSEVVSGTYYNPVTTAVGKVEAYGETVAGTVF